MSSHREAPEISKDPVADNTDVYAFRSPDRPDSVTILANFIPLQKADGGPNFYEFGDDVLYEIHIFNRGTAGPDITYQFRFTTEITNPETFLYNTGPIASIDDHQHWTRPQFFSVRRVEHGDSEVLATQGEPGDELFVIVSGSVQVLASGRAGQPVELARVDSGSYVGEMAILTGEPCMASLVAVGSLRVLTIGQKQFESILRDRPETSLAVIRVLCARLRDAEVGTNRNVDRNDGGAL